jgi:anti-sigma B factor antagonist
MAARSLRGMLELAMDDATRRIKRNLLTMVSQERAGVHLVRLEGEMDGSNARDLEDELTRIEGTGASRIVLDLTRLEFIDSTGLAVIIRAHWRSTNDGHSLDLTRPPRDVMRILELCGLDEELPFLERSQDGALGRVFLADLGGSDGEFT